MKDHYLTFTINFLSTAAFVLLSWLSQRLWRHFDSSKIRLRSRSFIGIIVIWILFSLVLIVLAFKQVFPINSILICLLLITIVSLFYAVKELLRFWNVGLTYADVTVSNGLDYSKALKLCKNQLYFLGTGAAKLSNNQEFENALLRCRSDQPIRFLLIKPDDNNLKKAAKRAGKDPEEYKHMVLSSLRRISDLRKKRDLDIEVKFYENSPTFRLMFINESICLVSYNVFGEGDGSQLPQLHFIRAPESRRVSASFYYSFELYFKHLWQKSSDWDFNAYLEEN